MVDVCGAYRDKKITLMGLGLLGRGVGDAAFLAECGANVLVTDKKSRAELADSVAKLEKYPNVTFRLGGHREEDFTECDLVLKAPATPLDSPFIAAAEKAGVPVLMSTALFAKHAREAGAIIVGVTGTRGKSTVTNMIYHTLKRAGKRVHLGGNVRGVSTLALLPQVEEGVIAVLELDSWQLQGFNALAISPDVAVFTNLMPDHQNYYPSMDAYFNDKAAIFRHQKAGDTLIAGKGLTERLGTAHTPSEALFPEPLPPEWNLRVPGAHNRENASLAAAALRALGLPESAIREGLESYEGLEGRLQFLREVGGVSIYNDNNATTPEATVAALRALDSGEKNIVLLMGGADKGLDMRGLLGEIEKTCKAVVLLSGTGTEKIRTALDAPAFDSLDEAFSHALSLASPGDSLLFSPAFASFGLFKNEYERNDTFVSLVQSL